jgi:hypothetical protein
MGRRGEARRGAIDRLSHASISTGEEGLQLQLLLHTCFLGDSHAARPMGRDKPTQPADGASAAAPAQYGHRAQCELLGQ